MMAAQSIAKPSLPTRRDIRIKAFQACYAFFTSKDPVDGVFQAVLGSFCNELLKSKNSSEDVEYLHELFFGTIKSHEQYLYLLANKVDNWEVERIALTDKIILFLGIHEMLNISEVPVKVTINECIEIAKIYSTEKSSQFVNGVLDSIYLELKNQNKINKTGRGLIDNP